jgi:hypothetical protein
MMIGALAGLVMGIAALLSRHVIDRDIADILAIAGVSFASTMASYLFFPD